MVVEEECGECGSKRIVCPACGDHKVTQAEWIANNGHALPLSADLRQAVIEAEDGDEVSFGTVCWNCGWEKERTMEISVEEH